MENRETKQGKGREKGKQRETGKVLKKETMNLTRHTQQNTTEKNKQRR